MNLNIIILIFNFIKAIRENLQPEKNPRYFPSRGDNPYEYFIKVEIPNRGDNADDSYFEAIPKTGGEYFLKNNNGYNEQPYDQGNSTFYGNNLQSNYDNHTIQNNDSRFTTQNKVYNDDSYNNYFSSYSEPLIEEYPLVPGNSRGDTDLVGQYDEFFNNPRGDINPSEFKRIFMQGDDPNTYDAQNGVSKDGKPNVAVVTQPKEENTQNNVSEKPKDGKNIEQPLAKNESNELIRDHQSTPQVFTRISNGKTQGDDQKSQHSTTGSYIPLEKLRMRKRLTFTCSRCIPVIKIDCV